MLFGKPTSLRGEIDCMARNAETILIYFYALVSLVTYMALDTLSDVQSTPISDHPIAQLGCVAGIIYTYNV